MNKLFYMILLAMLVLASSAVYAHDVEVDGIFYYLNRDKKIASVTYKGTSYSAYSNEYAGSVVIPEKITVGNYVYDVTYIDSDAFRDCGELTSITFSKSLTGCYSEAFTGCEKLKAVHISDLAAWCRMYFGVNCTPLKYATLYLNGEVLTSVEIPEEITEIKDYTFYRCSTLTSVKMHKGITSIGYCAFYQSGLTALEIPENVTKIGPFAFYGCANLSGEIVIPSKISRLERYAFAGCEKIVSVKIPESVKRLGQTAFLGCKSLEKIELHDKLEYIGWNCFYKTAWYEALPDGEVYIGKIFYTYKGLTLEHTHLDIKEGTIGITELGDWCAGITSINFPNSLISINSGAGLNYTAWYEKQPDGPVYAGKVLYDYKGDMPANTEIVIKEGTRGIAGQALFCEEGLVSVTLPESLEAIGDEAFSGCTNLAGSLIFPSGLKYFGDDVFFYCSSLDKVINLSSMELNYAYVKNIPGGVIQGDYVFSNVDNEPILEEYIGKENWNIVLPNSCYGKEYVLSTAFKGREDIYNVTISDGVTHIADSAFQGCTNLSYVEFPCSLSTIGDRAFEGCTNLSYVEFPYSVRTIGEEAFKDCEYLFSITFSWGLENIGKGAFFGCYNIQSICIDDLYSWCNIKFEDDLSNPMMYSYSGQLYINNIPVTYLEIPYGVTEIKPYSFAGCSNVSSISIPETVTTIGDYAFEYSGFSYVQIPNSVVNIGKRAFDNCWQLTYVMIPNSVKNIGEGAFANCQGLTGVLSLPEGLETIEDNTFNTCCQLTEVVIPSSVKHIGRWAFSNCYGLEKLVVPESLETVGDGAFYGAGNGGDYYYDSSINEVFINDFSAWCNIDFENEHSNPLQNSIYLNGEYEANVIIPEGVEEIKKYAFYICSPLVSVKIPQSVAEIGDYAFWKCERLGEIYCESDEPAAISDKVFNDYSATLYVPLGSKEKYQAADNWSNFENIAEMDFTGIDSIDATEDNYPILYYDLKGRAVENPSNGIYIKNGKKVFVR